MSKYFAVTQNNPKYKLEDKLAGEYEYLVYQHEKGKQGTPHCQGYVITKKQKKLAAIRELLPGCDVDTRKGTHEQLKKYCTKDESRTEGPYEFGTEPKKTEKGARTDLTQLYEDCKTMLPSEIREKNPTYYIRYHSSINKICQEIKKEQKFEEFKKDYIKEKIELKEWQQNVLDHLGDQSNRQVTWVVDTEGGKGKTFLSNCIQSYFSTFYSRGGKIADIAYAYNYEDYVIFDFTRESEGFINYSVIEMFKDGKLWSPKYDSQIKIFKPVTVLCLSNFYPDQTKMSSDRWDIINL